MKIVKKFETLAYKYADLLCEIIQTNKPIRIVGNYNNTDPLFSNYYGGLRINLELKSKGNFNCGSYDYNILFQSDSSGVFIAFNNTDDGVTICKEFNEKKYENLYTKCEEYYEILKQRVEEHFNLEKMEDKLKELEEKYNTLRNQIESIKRKSK